MYIMTMDTQHSKKYLLGFMSYCSHDPSAAMIEVTNSVGDLNYRFIHFEEGMLSRKKKSYYFPSRSVAACLDYFGIQLSDVHLVATDYMDDQTFVDTSLNYRHLVGDYIRANLDLKPNQIMRQTDHHYAHAMSSWVGSGYEDCAFLAIDGLGSSQNTHSVFVIEQGELKKIFSQSSPGIGALYSLITELIGFSAGEEGKTMGLAPYGEKLFFKNEFPAVHFGGVYNQLTVDYSKVINRSPNKFLLTDFNFSKFNTHNLYEDYRAYLAFQIQKELERCLVHLATEIKRLTGKNKLCLSGGVALNCVANEVLVNSKIFESVYVFPDSADSGLSVGLVFSALKVLLEDHEWKEFLIKYKHPKFAPTDAVPKVTEPNLDHLPWRNLDENSILSELENNSVIGIFSGGYEYGPRALGHRSFIANATSPKMKEILNTKIKHREAYRPFAPICLLEDFETFFDSKHTNHEFMSYAVNVKKIAQELIPSVVHYDNTARVQIATEDCGLIHKLLVKLKNQKGFGVLVNTSMNDNNEPIVFDELDAVSCFLRTNCDLLVVNDKMLFRQDLNGDVLDYSERIETAINVRNGKRFVHSLKTIMKSKVSSLQKFLNDYELISTYFRSYSSSIRLHKLIIDIRLGKSPRFNRIVVSNRESKNLESILEKYYCSLTEITNDILEIHDNPESVKLLLPKDFIVSYNLSNVLRDYDALGLIKSTDYVNFYDSRDFPIPNFDEFKNSLNVSLDELLKTYENVKTLEIDSAFKKMAQGKE